MRHAMGPILTAFLAACALFGVRAAEEAETPASAVGGEIVIGATFPLTGYLDTYGQAAYHGAVTAAKLINDAGGINGKRLVLEWRDNRSDAEVAAENIGEFAERLRLPAVIGPLFSDSVMAVLPLAEQLEIAVVSPMATIDAASHAEPWVFRASFSNSAMASALVRFQREKYGAETCCILFDSRHTFSRELADIVERAFIEHGGRVLGKYGFTGESGEKDYETPLRRIAAVRPDFIFGLSYALEATEMIRAAKELDIDTRFCGPSAWDSELVFDATGTRLAGTSFASALFEREFSYRPFRMFFDAMEQAGMDNPDAQAASAYDAVNMIAQAMRTGGETAEGVRRGLMSFRRLPLATGRMTVNEEGDTLKPVIIRVVERRDGRMVPVYAERYDP